MADYWTWARIRQKVRQDTGTEDEVFVDEQEMLGYANEAIDEIERQIHNLCEDYFLTRAVIPLVNGQEAYELPTDIYAMKIRSIIYRDGTAVWKVKRIRDWYKFEQYEVEQTGVHNTSQYGFFIINDEPGNPKILLAPTPNEDGTQLRIWYIRNANTLIDDNSICDIPEAVNYVMQYIKIRIYEKEHNPMLQKAMMDLEAEKQTTLASLSNKTPDDENELQPDYRLYEDML